jgi:hypothetical protein
MSEQTTINTAPSDNEQGFRLGVRQLNERVATHSMTDVTLDYDALSDTWSMRFGQPRASVSYFAPKDPRFIFRLDPVTGELTGIDLIRFKSSVIKTHPQFKQFLPPNLIQRMLHRHQPRPSSVVEIISRLVPAGAVNNHCQYA